MKKLLLTLGAAASVAACAAPEPVPPHIAMANRAAGYEYLMHNCGGYAGGFNEAEKLVQYAAQDRAKARALGATEQQIAQASNTVTGTVGTMAVIAGMDAACANLRTSLIRSRSKVS